MNVEYEVVRVDDARVLGDGVDAVDEPAAAVGCPKLSLLHKHVLPAEGDRLGNVVTEIRFVTTWIAKYSNAPGFEVGFLHVRLYEPARELRTFLPIWFSPLFVFHSFSVHRICRYRIQ